MGVTAVCTESAPKAIGPYSQAVRSGNLLFCSGQLPLDPATGTLVTSSIGEEARQALRNLRSVVEAGGATMAKVVKTTIFMTDLSAFQELNSVYAEFFRETFPARACVQVAALPRGARVEVDAIAVCCDEPPTQPGRT